MAPYPVVVTGLGVVCAIGRNVDEFWTSLMDGRSGLAELTETPFDAFEARVAGTVPDDWLYSTLDVGDRGPDRTAELATAAAREARRQAGLDRGIAVVTLSAAHAGRRRFPDHGGIEPDQTESLGA